MHKILVELLALLMMLVGCGTVPDLDGATYQVSYTDAGEGGYNSSTDFEIDGLTVRTVHTDYHPETTVEGEFEMTEEERVRIDELAEAVLAAPEGEIICADTPTGHLLVEYADGTEDWRVTDFCGQDEAVPLDNLLTYLTERFIP